VLINKVMVKIENLVDRYSKMPPIIDGALLFLLFFAEIRVFKYLAGLFTAPANTLIETILTPIAILTLFASIWRIVDAIKATEISKRVHRLIVLMALLMGLAYIFVFIGTLGRCL